MQRFLLSFPPRLRPLESLLPVLNSAGVTHRGVTRRGFSQKNIIRIPKNPPRSDSVTQKTEKAIKSKRLKDVDRRQVEEANAISNRASSRPGTRPPRHMSWFESGADIVNGSDDGADCHDGEGSDSEGGHCAEEEIVETEFEEHERESRNIPFLHFGGEDAGFRGTHILGSERTVSTEITDRSDNSRIEEIPSRDGDRKPEIEPLPGVTDFAESERDDATTKGMHSDDNSPASRQQSTPARQSTISEDKSSPQRDAGSVYGEIESGKQSREAGSSDDLSYRGKKQPKTKRDPKRYSKLRIDPKKEILYGISPCQLALQQDRRVVTRAFVLGAFRNSARPEAQEIGRMLEERGVAMHEMDRGQLNRLANGRPHQGICLEVSPLHLESLGRITGDLIALPEDSRACILAFDQILDPMNLGAVMRSAYFLGVDWVVASKYKCCPLTSTVSKASSGVVEVMPLYAAHSMEGFLEELSNHSWQILGATNRGQAWDDNEKPVLSCMNARITQPTVLLVGSEGFGLRPSLESYCDALVTVSPGRPLHRNIDSLNLSVATGILLHSLLAGR